MYRPPNWKNPHEIEYKPGINSAVDVAEGQAYEAGADAMLEGLRTDENRLDCIDQWGKEKPIERKGWIVFIPDGED